MVSSAFITTTPLFTCTHRAPTVSPRRTPQMSLRQNLSRAAAIIPTTIATSALATEGTGEGLGIDNPLLYLPLVLIPAAFFALFIQFAGSQNNEDFFGTYDERRK